MEQKNEKKYNNSHCCYFKFVYLQVLFGILIIITHYLIQLENYKIFNYNETNFECHNYKNGCCKFYDDCNYLDYKYTTHYIDVRENDNCITLKELVNYYNNNNEKCSKNYQCDNKIRYNISLLNLNKTAMNINCIQNKHILKYYQIEIYEDKIYNYKIFIFFCIFMFFICSLIIICEKYNNYTILDDSYP